MAPSSEGEPLVIVRAFVGMIIHHSLNNNLWTASQQLLRFQTRRRRGPSRIFFSRSCHRQIRIEWAEKWQQPSSGKREIKGKEMGK